MAMRVANSCNIACLDHSNYKCPHGLRTALQAPKVNESALRGLSIARKRLLTAYHGGALGHYVQRSPIPLCT